MSERTREAWCAAMLGVVVVLWLQPVEAQQDRVDDYVPVTDAMLRNPDPGDWLMAHRTYDFQAFSPLDEINRDNVGELRLAWMRAMDEGPQQGRPLVYDGVMYIANPGSDHLQALDATTGDLIWDYRWELPADLREYSQLGNRTRNLAIYGHHIFHLTADAHLIAVDARTGELAWESEMADYRTGITHSSGAMVIDGRVMSGRACSPRLEDTARCFIAAHDAATGREAWRFYTAAGADDPGGQTWGNLPTARRVHVSAWGLPGSYDPELGLVYWGIAVPAPYTRIVRHGTWDVGDRTPCELYSNSTVALAVDTGALDWYYQYLPCDDWDQDFVQERTLIDTVVDPDPDAVRWINPAVTGAPRERKVVVTIGEPGGLFVNDRETGEFLWAAPLPYTSTERFVIRDIDVETGQVQINIDLVAKEIGEQHIIRRQCDRRGGFGLLASFSRRGSRPGLFWPAIGGRRQRRVGIGNSLEIDVDRAAKGVLFRIHQSGSQLCFAHRQFNVKGDMLVRWLGVERVVFAGYLKIGCSNRACTSTAVSWPRDSFGK